MPFTWSFISFPRVRPPAPWLVAAWAGDSREELYLLQGWGGCQGSGSAVSQKLTPDGTDGLASSFSITNTGIAPIDKQTLFAP